jgi:hypothetical protein
MTRYHNNGDQQVAFSAEEETARDAEEAQVATDKADYIANHKYKDDRQVNYGPIGDQLDMQYWDAINGTTTWVDHVVAVKAKYKKPD